MNQCLAIGHVCHSIPDGMFRIAPKNQRKFIVGRDKHFAETKQKNSISLIGLREKLSLISSRMFNASIISSNLWFRSWKKLVNL